MSKRCATARQADVYLALRKSRAANVDKLLCNLTTLAVLRSEATKPKPDERSEEYYYDLLGLERSDNQNPTSEARSTTTTY